ncbi:hypothetical protein T12_5789 [Trichinella patagoniensis]|uniref:Uncharacterized protein n=1 Tax=Trichinella patagoniensis TaxID=990121 RepID=A0A0V0Z016_9BILA|nr:hypothetical protein T12_5789 [Trichinella patagoniensis]
MTSLIAGKAITGLCREEMENGCIVGGNVDANVTELSD